MHKPHISRAVLWEKDHTNKFLTDIWNYRADGLCFNTTCLLTLLYNIFQVCYLHFNWTFSLVCFNLTGPPLPQLLRVFSHAFLPFFHHIQTSSAHFDTFLVSLSMTGSSLREQWLLKCTLNDCMNGSIYLLFFGFFSKGICWKPEGISRI